MTIPLTTRQRRALGQAQRKHMRRAEHAGWQSKTRHADPLKLLADSIRGRVPALASIKYDRMAASPFGFFRGAVPIMASDLSLGPNTGIHTQLCGDAHVRNLGSFAGPDGRLVFDINDFDETIRGPFEWDVKRMATSLILAGREAGAKNGPCRDAAHTFLERYRTMMQSFTRMTVLDVARFQVHRLRNVESISQVLRIAERATPLHSLETLTMPAPSNKKLPATSELSPGIGTHPRIFQTIEPTLTRVPGDVARSVLDSLTTYAESLLPERQRFLSQYTPLDVAFKIVGTGSVGLRDYCIYMQGNGAKDPLFIQVKEEAHSAYTPYLGEQPTPAHQGRRVVEGQRAMQLQSDPFLGWTTIEGRDYLVRQLNDHKASVNLTTLKSAGLLEYAKVCGEILARGHARAGDPSMLAGYIGTSDRFDVAIAKFATDYADQTDRDWQALVRSRTGNKPKPKPESEPKHAAKSKPKPQAEPEAKLKPKPKVKSKAKPKVKLKAKPDSPAQADQKSSKPNQPISRKAKKASDTAR
jgi:uncharacterized protein (DUF2252 family)